MAKQELQGYTTIGQVKTALDKVSSIANVLPTETSTKTITDYTGGYRNASGELVSKQITEWASCYEDVTDYRGGTATIINSSDGKYAAKNGFLLTDGSISLFNCSGVKDDENVVSIPSNAVKLFASFQIYAGGIAKDGYSVTLSSSSVVFASVPSKKEMKDNTTLANKTWQVLGDSISTVGAYVAVGEHYYNLIADRYDMDFTDADVNANGGRSIAYNTSSGVVGSFVEKVAELTTAKDIVTILGGVNDYIFNTPIGTMGKDSNGNITIPSNAQDCTTFYDALKYIYNYILTNFPSTRLFHILPLRRGSVSTSQKNSIGNTIDDYWNAIIEVADYFCVGVIPLGKECSVNPRVESLRQLYFATTSDQGQITHPNKLGQQRMAEYIGSKMLSMI